MYIQRATLNGHSHDNAWFHHDQLTDGGTLELWMGPEPNEDWGVAELPPSKSPEAPAVLHTTRDTVRVDSGETGTLTLAADNLTDRPVAATWHARTPAGIEVQPAEGDLTAPAGDTAEQDLTVRVNADTPAGLHRLVITGQTADGTELPDAITYIHVAPVLSIETAPDQLILLQGTPSTIQVQVNSNDVDRAHAGDVSLRGPEGWTVEPATRSFDVPAGGKTTTTFTLTPPADASGEQSLTVTAQWEGGGFERELSATVSRKVALLGSVDLATGEFALSPDRFGDYPTTFPDDVDFTIGTSDPATAWSYIHPGPSDTWAGAQATHLHPPLRPRPATRRRPGPHRLAHRHPGIRAADHANLPQRRPGDHHHPAQGRRPGLPLGRRIQRRNHPPHHPRRHPPHRPTPHRPEHPHPHHHGRLLDGLRRHRHPRTLVRTPRRGEG